MYQKNVRFRPIADVRTSLHAIAVKAFALLPAGKVYDGTGVLSAEQSSSLDLLAVMLTDALRQGGDDSHAAVIWEDAPIMVGTPPIVTSVSDRDDMIALARRCLDPYDAFGGDIRSRLNCRVATFGYDGQAYVCLRHEDAVPTSPDTSLVTVDEPEWLLTTDWFDGGWPHT